MTRVTSMAGGVFTGQLTSALIQAVSLILLARYSNPQIFGRAGAIIAATTVLMVMGDAGLAVLAVKLAARNPRDPDINVILKLTLASSLLISGLVLTGMLVLGGMDAEYYEFLPLAVWMVSEKRLATRSAIAVSCGMVVASTISIISARVASLLIFFALLETGAPPTLAYALGYAGGASLGLILVRRAILPAAESPNRYSFHEIKAFIRPMFRRGAPFLVATMSYQVRTLDVAIVSVVAGPAVAGIYAVPARLSAPLRLLPTALNTVTMPIVAAGDPDMLKQLRRLIRSSWIVLALLLATVALYAETIITTLLGAEYRQAANPLLILCPGIALNIVGAARSALLQASGDEVFIAKVGTVLGVASVVGVTLGATWGGASGAALGMTTTYVLQFIVVHSRGTSKVITSV